MMLGEQYGERFPLDLVRQDEAAPVYCCPRPYGESCRLWRARRVSSAHARRFRLARRWTRTYNASDMPW